MTKITTILTIIFITCINLSAQTEPTDTDNDGYLNVSTLDHLRWISENPSSWGNDFELDNDINTADTENWNEGAGFSPIGNNTTKFTGIFDGKGFKIDSLYINRPSQTYLGLFGYTYTTDISDIGLTNCNISGTSDYVGGLAGYIHYTDITGCYTSGSVSTSGSYVGGLVGYSKFSDISESYSSSSVNGYERVGGLVGLNYTSANISNCNSTGNVTGNTRVGGLVGYNYSSSSVSNCYSTGNVNGYYSVGGLIGNNHSSNASNSYSTSPVSGTYNVGGLIGYNDYSGLSNSYCTGSVDGSEDLGGLIGENHVSTVSNCYSVGGVTGGSYNFGGLIGNNDNSDINNCFWDIETSGLNISDGGTGKTTEDMKTVSTYTFVGWNFTSIWAVHDLINNGYPFLQLFYFLPPNLISPADEVSNLSSSLTLKWNKPSDAINYQLQLSKTSSFENVLLNIILSDTNKTISGLEYATTYYWRVRAFSTSDTSIWSIVYSFTTQIQQFKLIDIKLAYKGYLVNSVHKPISVIVELRDGTSLMTSDVAAKQAALVDGNGNVSLNFGDVNDGNYWILVRASGFLPVCTTNKQSLSVNGINYDFTTASSQSVLGAYSMVNVNDIWQIRSGDMDGDGSVGAFDVNFLIPNLGKSVSSGIPD